MFGDMISDSGWGFISVIGAVVFFGSSLVPLKRLNRPIDPIIYQFYGSISIVLTAMLTLIWQEFKFSPWGILGATLWLSGSFIAIFAVTRAGLVLSQSTWSGVTIIVSWLYGRMYFGEKPNSWILTMLALFLLLLSIVAISISNSQYVVNLPKNLEWVYRLHWLFVPMPENTANADSPKVVEVESDSKKIAKPGESYGTAGESYGTFEQDSMDASKKNNDIELGKDTNATAANNTQDLVKKLHKLQGLVAAIVTGLLNGSVMVPAKLSGLPAISYLFSFAVGIAIMSLLAVLLDIVIHQCLWKKWPDFSPTELAIPGLAGGFIWSIGNCFSIYATYYLGLTVGYPLTQTSLLIGAVWGIIVFREFKRPAAIIHFLCSATLLLGAAAMLSIFGTS